MKSKLSIFVPALCLLLPVGTAFGQSTDMDDCKSMLALAVESELHTQGYDTTNACHLTVMDLASIKHLLTEDGDGHQGQIQLILTDAKAR